jgi:pimeloyl-ACP methyl ester carboxylesterase
VKSESLENLAVVGHSMGGMVSLTFAGAFPEKVSRLVVLDGVTNFPARRVKPIELRIADWVGDLDKTAQRKPCVMRRWPMAPIACWAQCATDPRQRYTSPPRRANPGGGYSWKFDPYLRARASYRLSLEDNIALVAHRLSTLLVTAASLRSETAGVLGHFQQLGWLNRGAGRWNAA